MLKTLSRTGAALLAVASLGFSAIPAYADGMGDIYNGQAMQSTNTSIKHAMDAQNQKPAQKQATQSSSTVAQVPPVVQKPISGAVGLPTGFGYTVDLSIAYPYGNIGQTGKQWLPGGVDLVAAYGFNPTTRLVASQYQLQHYPVGFNTGTAPVYLQGFANPIGCADLSGGNSGGCTPTNLNLTTKDTFDLFMLQKMFFIGGMPGGKKLPIVISPTYVARTSYISQSGNNRDQVPFAINPPDGPIYTGVYTRSAQVESVAFTVPFLKTTKMFGTFTVAPSWLVHLAGANQQNKVQLYQIAYLEYTPTDRLTFFFEPQSSRDYLPTDQYAQHLFAYFLGASYKTTKTTFIQATLNSGGPTNEGAYGVHSIVCANLSQVAANNCAANIGGLKATQIQVQFGIGTPSVLPF